MSRHQPDDDEKTPDKTPKKKDSRPGALTIEEYLKVIGAPQLEDVRKTALEAGGNGSGGKSPSVSSPAKRVKRLGRAATGAIVALLIISTYAAGATWQWGGKWYQTLTMENAILVVEDDAYSGDELDVAMGRIRTQILRGLRALGRATEKEGSSGEWAVTHIENTKEQVDKLLAEVRDR